MQTTAWITLFRRIPPDQHDALTIVTGVGVEISIQDILRIEEDYLVLRGRLAGTTDMGRIFFIPYSHIVYLGFQKEVRVAQIMALYGEGPAAAVAGPKPEALDTPAEDAEPVATAAISDTPPPPEANPPAEPPKPAAQLKIPRKSGLLERLRARAQAASGPRAPTNP